MDRIPASERTREALKALMDGRCEATEARSDKDYGDSPLNSRWRSSGREVGLRPRLRGARERPVKLRLRKQIAIAGIVRVAKEGPGSAVAPLGDMVRDAGNHDARKASLGSS